MPATAEIKVSVTDLPQVKAFMEAAKDLVEEVELVIGSLEHGDHLDNQAMNAEQLRLAVDDFWAAVENAGKESR